MARKKELSRQTLLKAEIRHQEFPDINKRKHIRVALVYPNIYGAGMANLGFQTVYRLINEQENAVCERVFLPEPLTKHPFHHHHTQMTERQTL